MIAVIPNGREGVDEKYKTPEERATQLRQQQLAPPRSQRKNGKLTGLGEGTHIYILYMLEVESLARFAKLQ